MAKKNEDIDGIFRERLLQHEQKPSALAWEKLEAQLPKKNGEGRIFLWRIAASLLLLGGLGYFIWNNVDGNGDVEGDKYTVHDQQNLPIEVPETSPEVLPEIPDEATDLVDEEPDAKPSGTPKPIKDQEPKSQPKPAQDNIPVPKQEKLPLLAENEIQEKPEYVEAIEVDIPNLAEPKLEQTLAEQVPPPLPQQEEVSYKVRIVSNGFSAEAPKETIVEEITEKIDKIGGLLNKVDQGFADLQDAKYNLFASITNKKEKTK